VSDTIVRVENLSKKYTIGHQQEGRYRYKSLRDAIADGAKSISSRVLKQNGRNISNPTQEEFWALKDVSFEVKQGDRVGIIGRNGAGKSTLLKILSRITEPTSGRIKIKGRVASLLEVGTGFHPELTGRENIYLNGAILGMSKVEIKRKFDEIVDFAEVEKFLDTPVKRYSSGMYVRLAFAVAAHLEPEILVVDEVLAVGDATFQKKCLGKMSDVSVKEGRTVLFVSHNMTAINSLCEKAIILNSGRILSMGEAKQVTDKYLSLDLEKIKDCTASFPQPKNLPLWIESATVICDEMASTQLYMGGNLAIDIVFKSIVYMRNITIGFVIYSSQGEPIINANNHYQKSELETIKTKNGTIRCNLGVVPLMQGTYSISLWLSNGTQDYHCLEKALFFEAVEQDIWGKGRTPTVNMSFLWWPTNFNLLENENS
jgi:lipopolysaccharide transport system ATP-binding protein